MEKRRSLKDSRNSGDTIVLSILYYMKKGRSLKDSRKDITYGVRIIGEKEGEKRTSVYFGYAAGGRACRDLIPNVPWYIGEVFGESMLGLLVWLV